MLATLLAVPAERIVSLFVLPSYRWLISLVPCIEVWSLEQGGLVGFRVGGLIRLAVSRRRTRFGPAPLRNLAVTLGAQSIADRSWRFGSGGLVWNLLVLYSCNGCDG